MLEVAGSSDVDDPDKHNYDELKLSHNLLESFNFIFGKEKYLGKPVPDNLVLIGLLSKNNELVFKGMMRIDDFLIQKQLFVAEVPNDFLFSFEEMRNLLTKMLTVSNVVQKD
nr:9156_t:CDS:2 [Entrophospora candida]